MISEYISKLEQKIDLTYTQMNEIMSEVLSGKTNDDENMSFLSNLSKKVLELLSFSVAVITKDFETFL